MPAAFLHGVEIVEVDTGTRPIRLAASSVIGIVGTAPGADESVFPLNTPVLIRGSAGEAAKLYIDEDGEANQGTLPAHVDQILRQTGALIVVVRVAEETTAAVAAKVTAGDGPYDLADGDTLKVKINGGVEQTLTFATGDFVDIDAALPAEVVAALSITGATVAVVGDGFTITTNTAPGSVQITGGSALTALGLSVGTTSGTAEAVNTSATRTNVIGGVDGTTGQYEGLHALLGAQGELGVTPRIIITPGFSDNSSVRAELVTIAERLRAVAIIDGPNTTDAAALSVASGESSRRLYLIDPWVECYNTIDGAAEFIPASSTVAGVIARTDNDRGFWWSPSNQATNGVTRTYRSIDFALGDASSRANGLNEGNVATIIREQGFRLWGNRTLSSDAKWAFLSVVRTADIINESILRAHLWAVDRGITRTYLEDVANGVKAFLAQLKAQGAILGGDCWPNPDLNTPTSIASGQVYFDFDFTPPFPAERVTFRSILTNGYISEILEG